MSCFNHSLHKDDDYSSHDNEAEKNLKTPDEIETLENPKVLYWSLHLKF